MGQYSNRVPLGVLNGIQGEVGTILGPNEVGKYLIIIKNWDKLNACAVGWAKSEDITTAAESCAVNGPRSLTELRLINYYRRQHET